MGDGDVGMTSQGQTFASRDRDQEKAWEPANGTLARLRANGGARVPLPTHHHSLPHGRHHHLAEGDTPPPAAAPRRPMVTLHLCVIRLSQASRVFLAVASCSAAYSYSMAVSVHPCVWACMIVMVCTHQTGTHACPLFGP